MGMTKVTGRPEEDPVFLTRSGVDIPAEAYEAALAVPGTRDMVRSYMTHTLCTQGSAEADVLQAVEAAAPLIVAAELEQLADYIGDPVDHPVDLQELRGAVEARIQRLRGEA